MNPISVPFLDLNTQHAELYSELRTAFDRVVSHGRFILGAETEEFENQVAKQVGASHAVGVSSGSDALLVALMAMGVGPGDEVITTPFSFFATAGSIARLGAKPVFVDIDPVTFNIDPSRVRTLVTSQTKAIIPVHLFGQVAEIESWAHDTVLKKIPVLEDAAQALGAHAASISAKKVYAGAMGTAAAFSFFPSKNLGGLGDGGMVTTSDEGLYEKIRILRAHGSKPKYHHPFIGGNFRLDALQAAFLKVKLPHLARWMSARQKNAQAYSKAFQAAAFRPEVLTVPECTDGHAFNQYAIRTQYRDQLRKNLKDAGIGTEIYYPAPLHFQPCFKYLGHKEGDFPNAERVSQEVLALPVFPELRTEQRARVIEQVIQELHRIDKTR